ncbi:hypothetical protein Ocin01_01845 [Orchesella cincta]|uniref:Uncharacterized protein n=1 Tax=Orchesella cincta TaxID=48709 RepID=A0A1D2NHU8_ORCCI|nr:hypothetical protein Ocin01_01845 [Orchesella cincta]
METEDYILWVSVGLAALAIAALLFWFCLQKLNELWKTRKASEVPVYRQETVTTPPDLSRRRDVNINSSQIFPGGQFRESSTSTSRRANVYSSDNRRRDLESLTPQILPHQSTTNIPPRNEIIINVRSHYIYPTQDHLNVGGKDITIQIPPQPKAKKKPRKKPQAQREREDNITSQITAFQDNLRSDENPHETVEKVQKLLLSLENCSEDNGAQCNLIIGVDATPCTQAGYCVNLVDKTLKYYVLKKQHLPWNLHDEKDTAEFEMKNLIFALTVWKEIILKFKRIRVYTDNFAIVKPKDKYGGRAKRYLDHFVKCEKVTIINRGSLAVNRFKNLKYFAKYIQPADDLSRWQIDEAVDFLTRLYKIDKENVLGTHQKHPQRKRKHSSSLMTAELSPVSKTWYNPTENYKQLLDLADTVIECHLCGNSDCSSILTSSLRIKRSSTA